MIIHSRTVVVALAMSVQVFANKVFANDVAGSHVTHVRDPLATFADKAVNRLVGRAVKLSLLRSASADMDTTTLAKAQPQNIHNRPCSGLGRLGQFPTPSRTGFRLSSPASSMSHSDSSGWGKHQQPQCAGARSRLTQVRAEKEGYKFGDFTKKAMQAMTEAGKQVTGDENYKIGDLTKGAVRASLDRAKSDSGKMKDAADAAGKVITEDEGYQFGDITKGVLKGAQDLMGKAGNAIELPTSAPVNEEGNIKEPSAPVNEKGNKKEPPKPKFDRDLAVLLSGFAFEAYNEPSETDARWERGADGTDVAFMSEVFAAECYNGRLEITLREAKDLPGETQQSEKLLSGDEPDPYVIFALNEEAPEGPKEGAMALVRAVDRARSSTRWAKDAPKGTSKGAASWSSDERFFLYVKDPNEAQLALTVMDEDVMKEDDPVGAASVKLSSLLSFNGTEAERSWTGWIPLTWRPEETQDYTVMAGTMAGAMVAGPVGAAAGGFIGSLMKKPVQGEVRIDVRYTPLDGSTLVTTKSATKPEEVSLLSKILPDSQAEEQTAPALASGVARGATEGLDWSELVQVVGAEGADAFELLCFVSQEETSTQAAMWRDRSTRRIVLSFRGTSDITDALTDIKLGQVPLEEFEDGKESDDDRYVHIGFKTSAMSITRRFKELLVSACIGTPGEWDVLVTGHSLGGALATLMATEIATGVDTSRSLKMRADNSWFAQLVRAAQDKLGQGEAVAAPIQLGRVRLYTFGAPRVGNSAFASFYNSLGIDSFRIVNGADIVPRMPRHANSAGAILDYEHVGQTVLISDGDEGSPDVSTGFWVEGESDGGACPLRDVSPFTNPFGPKTIIGDLGACVTDATSAAWDKVQGAQDMGSAARSLWEAAAELDKRKGDLESKIKSITPLEAVSVLGLDSRFVKSELAMLDSIKRGTFLNHHLEPSYFAAMKNALNQAAPQTRKSNDNESSA
eukprot:gnl/MRDRNA2_/MRDRNA2_31364_c0_seq1.p1 gnl/MRDRNA2_/MRDRNA2_31364_c0~~gnl/MRDRNA2_/MRDRNA2_31364_c0_seq1.p1  ORF type:complete len:965 (+),score=201.88 gnl/MRDRNA2_/MRDRNA2_31364_c0_seq1:101-2995(+)